MSTQHVQAHDNVSNASISLIAVLRLWLLPYIFIGFLCWSVLVQFTDYTVQLFHTFAFICLEYFIEIYESWKNCMTFRFFFFLLFFHLHLICFSDIILNIFLYIFLHSFFHSQARPNVSLAFSFRLVELETKK